MQASKGDSYSRGIFFLAAQRIPGSSFVHMGNPIHFKVVGKTDIGLLLAFYLSKKKKKKKWKENRRRRMTGALDWR